MTNKIRLSKQTSRSIDAIRIEIWTRRFVLRPICWLIGHSWITGMPFACGRCFYVDYKYRRDFWWEKR